MLQIFVTGYILEISLLAIVNITPVIESNSKCIEIKFNAIKLIIKKIIPQSKYTLGILLTLNIDKYRQIK